jgi:hypothetical protein
MMLSRSRPSNCREHLFRLEAVIFILALTIGFSVQVPTWARNSARPGSPKSTYKRKDWPHWTKGKEGTCFNTRHWLLNKRSEVKVEVNRKGRNCTVKAGEWRDYYYDERLTALKNIDVDHLIPLKHAHDIGGWKWSRKEREVFANDPENLVITNKKYNRQKGAKTIADWLPINRAYACKYYRDWMKVKKKYALPVSESEKSSVDLTHCPK